MVECVLQYLQGSRVTNAPPLLMLLTLRYTADEDFTGADAVLESLGDPPVVNLSLSDAASFLAQKATTT